MSGPEFFVFPVVASFALIGVLLTVFWLWMLIDCVRFEPDTGSTKVIWVLILIFLGWIGALLYLFIRRPERRALFGR